MSKKVISKFLHELISLLETLSEADLKKLETGEYTFDLKILKKDVRHSVKLERKDVNYSEAIEKLNTCDSRELGYDILNTYFSNKKELELFAKYIDIYVMKQDKVDKIKEKIIEGTIGATLRSSAIQKNNI